MHRSEYDHLLESADAETARAALYGTGQGIHIGSQVIVDDHGMGTVTAVGCPVFGPGGTEPIDGAGPAYHVRIEGDREPICFPASRVTLYADAYAAMT